VTPGVDFFRVDRSGPTRRLLVVGGILVSCGASTVGAHLMHRLPESTGHLVSLAGGICMIGGLVLAFGSLAMMLFENVYLAVREDGVLLHDNGKETCIAWDDLAAVAIDDDRAFLSLRRVAGEPVRWYAGSSTETIVTRVTDAKRKAAHGLLRVE